MKLHNRNAQVRVLALIALLGASYSSAEAQQRAWAEAKQIPAAAVACYFRRQGVPERRLFPRRSCRLFH